jgi:4-aminobutyrate aminotransferase-like enzyme
MEPPARQILDMNAFDAGEDGGSHDPLLSRRLRNMGPASVLFYREPIEMVRAEGAWMEAADGSRYLDFYNNVPSVGHSHPRVVEAVSRQIARLNVNSRYLTEIVETYLEQLKATLPKALSNVVLTCSASEANDLAMRVAIKATGASGFIVTETAYHGNTHLVTQISPSAFKTGAPPGWVAIVPPPDRSTFGGDIASGLASAVQGAIERLAARGIRPAAFICDTIFSSDGVFADPPGFLAPAVAVIRASGGLFIADEVQPGFGRTGDAMWGFLRHQVTPDLVTMGKPMGNGFPMAGLAARPDLLAAFTAQFGYFNTFGANPVAAAAGLAVLDAIEADGLLANAARVGTHLKGRLETLAKGDPRLGAVRGAGLFLGVDLCSGDPAGTPDPELASAVINNLGHRQVLIGAAGRYGHTLKLRPPLCLSEEEADIFLDALVRALAE